MSKKDKYQNILQQIESARPKRPNQERSVQILAVSKLQSPDNIQSVYDLGVKNFGENYLQEAREKQELLKGLNIEWHFIGNLQRKKIKDLVGHFELFHSVDSLALIDEIDKRAQAKKLRQKILIQLNLAKETSKGGVSEEEGPALLEAVQGKPGVQLCGLMTMPPLADNPEKAREFFAKTYELSHNWSQYLDEGHSLDELSMGTSQDFVVAVEEGATIVRLGSVLMGPRPAKG